jgi:2-polyprenyl-6-methoxyphenol hydroxylase-like FAD-dependent oxidoreductase
MFDVIVVGARCAGAPLSMLLARKGYRVLLVDKAHFPSDTVSTHVVWQAGLAHAKRWGLLDKITGLGAPPIRTVRLNVGPFELAGSPPPLDGIDYAIAPRRTVLDKLLVDAAVAAGAELREGVYVSEIESEGDRVTGIRGRTSSGNQLREQARMVVGADGTGSFVAHAVQAAKYNTRPSTATAYYAYWEDGPAVTDFETYLWPNWGAAVLPTNDGLTCLVGGWNEAAGVPEGRPEEGYAKLLEMFPRMAEFRRQGKQVEPVRGMREQAGFFRQSWGPGWALAGDAGYHKHPLSAQGITDAFRDAERLSEALDAGFSGRSEMKDALATYQRQRDETVMPMYQSTCDRALLQPPPPEIIALFSALRHNRPQMDRFFGTDAGTVPIPEFFSPENVASIMQSAPGGAARSGRAG